MGLHRYMLDKSWDYIGTLSGPVLKVVGLHRYAHIPSEADFGKSWDYIRGFCSPVSYDVNTSWEYIGILEDLAA